MDFNILNENVVNKFNNKDGSIKYAEASPFPHIIIDNLWTSHALNLVLSKFPSHNNTKLKWHIFNAENEKGKKGSKVESLYKVPLIKSFLDKCNESDVNSLLENITGIQKLLPDFEYNGGGMHSTKRGGYLNIHSDFNKLDDTTYRRLNMLIYLNKDWPDKYGGHLELWNKERTACEKTVLPVFNRTVIFSTTLHSYHGHPKPCECPRDRSRKSLALYYYTKEAIPDEPTDPHSTIFI